MKINGNLIRILILSLLFPAVCPRDSRAAETGTIAVTVTVEELAIEAGVRLDVLPGYRGGRAGSTVSTRARVTNRGKGDDYFKLTASSSLGWEVSFPEGDTTKPLKPRRREFLPIHVTIPPDAARFQTDNITITATSQSDPSVSDSDLLVVIAR